MEQMYIEQQINRFLCKEFQAIWLIKLEDLSLNIYTSHENKAIPGSVKTAFNMNSYEEARLWYIDNCVAEQSKEKMLDQTRLENVISNIVDDEPFFVEYQRINNGEINFNQLCYDKITNPDNGKDEYLIMGFRNIDITKKAEIDDITGLYIRTAFFKKAEEMIAKHPDKQFDIVISDIIDFKKVNEIYGTDVADNILKWHGNYLLSLADDDMIIGRYGGDQMVMIGSHERTMECLSPLFRDRFFEEKRKNDLPDIVIKYGIYLDVNKSSTIISACDKAHMALNSIKHRYNTEIAYYNDEMQNYWEKQRRIEESMHTSLQNNDFKVYYQPKHEAGTGKLVGAEALIRWIHPEYGFMSPADFIPLFEQNGFIVESDRFVWNKTCENIRRWQDSGISTVPISVNGSKLTIVQEDLIEHMTSCVNNHKLEPDQLHIEITETLMEEDTTALVNILNDIRKMGFKVELDDFGSGYSSLNVLSALPLDVVKLDMSFMQQFGDKKRLLVLESCINLAKKLGFETVSEGVETKEQQELLGQLGVDRIQGYYYSKPLPENEFEIYMMQHSYI